MDYISAIIIERPLIVRLGDGLKLVSRSGMNEALFGVCRLQIKPNTFMLRV